MSDYATIVDKARFNADETVEMLNDALNTGNNKSVIDLIVGISSDQRKLLREPFKQKYDKDLLAVLSKKFSGDLENLVNALMETPLEYDVKQLMRAMKGLGTDENVLIEIICSRTPSQLKEINKKYESTYQKLLENDIIGETSGQFRDLLVALIRGSKDDSKETNDEKAMEDAKALFGAGKGIGKEEKQQFFTVLSTRNMFQLRKIFQAYEGLSGVPLDKTVEKEFSGDLQRSYLTIIRSAAHKQKYFASQLYASMKGIGTRDNDLIRVIVTRSEVDLELIKKDYIELYEKTLASDIKGDTSGMYRDTLLAIVAGNKHHF